MSIAKKLTTGLTGLKVVQNSPRSLGVLYTKILNTLQNMPENAAYRKHTEQLITERAAVLKQTADPIQIENMIGCGQIEELIIQAQNELNLARNMLTWKAWEPLASQPPEGQWDWPPRN